MVDQRARTHTLFCDDVRFEVDGKQTLVGVYGGEMVFPPESPYPIGIAKLAVVFYIKFPEDNRPREIALKIEYGNPEDYQVLFETLVSSEDFAQLSANLAEYEPDELADGRQRVLTGSIVFPPFAIEKPSFIRATAVLDGETTYLGRLRVRTASER